MLDNDNIIVNINQNPFRLLTFSAFRGDTWVVGVVAVMVYCRRIDHGVSMEWAGDGACII